MFPLGYFDKEVTNFLTINVKYGISLVLLYALYLYAAYLEVKLRESQAEEAEARERLFTSRQDNQRLNETICKIKSKK